MLLIGLLAMLYKGHHYAIELNNEKQAACAARTLEQAMKHCGANKLHYRLGKSESGFETLTLFPPGTTDQAWNCLSSWEIHAPDPPALKIDESVYDTAREALNPSE